MKLEASRPAASNAAARFLYMVFLYMVPASKEKAAGTAALRARLYADPKDGRVPSPHSLRECAYKEKPKQACSCFEKIHHQLRDTTTCASTTGAARCSSP